MRYLRITILITILFSILSCEKEAEIQSKDYPYVVTNSPNVSSEGAVFTANIKSLGNQKIYEYGFVWSTESGPTIQNSNKLYENQPEKGSYSYNLNSGLAKGQPYFVRAYIHTDQYEVYGNERSFISQGSLLPVIRSFEPKYGLVGTKVTIVGDNFAISKNGNTVKFGSNEAIIDSFSENRLIVTVPLVSQSGTVPISVETAGMQTTSNDFFDLWFPWKQLSDFPGTRLQLISSFVLDNKIYVCGGLETSLFQIMNEVWEYDPALDKWTQKTNFPGVPRYNGIGFSCNGKGYYGMGETYAHTIDSNILTDIWEYDPELDSWTKKTDFPGVPIIYSKAFVIGNKTYISPGKYWKDSRVHFVNDFWEYDPANNSWQQKKDFPGVERYWGFAIGTETKGYIGLGNQGNPLKDIYMYDPMTDSWETAIHYPGAGYNDVANFYINGKLYLGMGSNNSTSSYTDMYESDFNKHSWKKMYSSPVKLSPFISHAINGKGYVGYGWYDLSSKDNEYGRKMFEFDPSKN